MIDLRQCGPNQTASRPAGPPQPLGYLAPRAAQGDSSAWLTFGAAVCAVVGSPLTAWAVAHLIPYCVTGLPAVLAGTAMLSIPLLGIGMLVVVGWRRWRKQRRVSDLEAVVAILAFAANAAWLAFYIVFAFRMLA